MSAARGPVDRPAQARQVSGAVVSDIHDGLLDVHHEKGMAQVASIIQSLSVGTGWVLMVGSHAGSGMVTASEDAQVGRSERGPLPFHAGRLAHHADAHPGGAEIKRVFTGRPGRRVSPGFRPISLRRRLNSACASRISSLRCAR